MESDQIEIRSEEVQEIMGTVPSWIIRWGITVLFLGIFIILAISYFIQYPDIIEGEVNLTTLNPPVKTVVRTNGKIRKIYADEGDFIQEGSILAEIENPSNAENILFLDNVIKGFDRFFAHPEQYHTELLEKKLIAGDLQIEYNNLRKAYKDFHFFLNTNFFKERIRNLELQINNYQALSSVIDRQKTLIQNELKIARERFESDKILMRSNAISKIDCKESENKFILKQVEYENSNRTAIDNQILLAENEKNLLELEHNYEELKRAYIINIQNIINNIRNMINLWEQNYLLKAPVSGTLSFLKNWTENQYVNTGDELFAVIPSGKELGGIIYLPSHGLGKVRIGQKVRIKIHDYPHEQFGQVLAQVVSVSLISKENRYKVSVRLIDGLSTTYKKRLEFKPEMKGRAEIITDELSILERIFNKLNNLLKKTLN